MNNIKNYVEQFGDFKVCKLDSGFDRIYKRNNDFIIGLVCNDSKFSGIIKTTNGDILYSAKFKDLTEEDVKNKISEFITMFNNVTKALSSEAKESKDDEKEILLSGSSSESADVNIPGINTVDTENTEVVVGPSGLIVASNDGESQTSVDDIIVENPITATEADDIDTAEDTGLKSSNDSNTDSVNADDNKEKESNDNKEETEKADETIDENADLVKSVNDMYKQLVEIADKMSALINDLGDDYPDKKLVGSGLTSSVYSAACDMKSFIDEFLVDNETGVSDENSGDLVKESLSVPSKTSYIDIARGNVDAAKIALSNLTYEQDDKKHKMLNTILDVLSDISGELITQFN